MYATTWALEMRHIYDLGSTRINSSTLEINVVDILTARLNPSYPDGSTVPYLQIFGLDQTDMAATGPPDGRIDLSGGRVDVIRGLLYFPVSQAFRPDASSVDAWTNGEFSFTGPYAAQYDASLAIYNEELTPTRADEVHQYMIQVRTVE
jgi:cell surface protein SprA